MMMMMKTLNSSKISASFVCAMDSPRTQSRNIKKINLYLLNHLTHDDLTFEKENKYIDGFKKSHSEYKSVGEIGLFEIYGNDEFLHLFFDVDHITNKQEIDDMINYFNGLSQFFGNYSMGCYTNNDVIAEELNINFQDESDKFFSAHIVFYESKISKQIFKKYFKPNDLYTDDSTWKDILNGNERLMRHPISDKVWKNKLEPRFSSIVDNKWKPLQNSTQLINIRGDEFEITDEICLKAGLTPNDESSNPWDNKQNFINTKNNYKDGDGDNVEVIVSDESLINCFKHMPEVHFYRAPSLFMVFLGLNSLSDSIDERRRLYELAEEHLTLGIHARTKYETKINECLDKCGNVGCLVNLFKLSNQPLKDIKIINYDEEKNEEEEEEEEEVNEVNTFKTSDYTFEQFQEEQSTIKTVKKLLNKLKLCLAVNLKGGFILRTNEGIETMNKADLIQRFDTKWKFGDKKVSLGDLLTINTYKSKLDKFKGVLCDTTDESYVSLFIPPKPREYRFDIVESFINCYLSRVKYQKPFNDLLDCLAYNIRNPTVRIVRYYIQYGKGDDGKSLLFKILNGVYGSSFKAGEESEIIEKYNGWKASKKIIGIEEAEPFHDVNNEKNAGLSHHIKTMTTEIGSVRGMYKESRDYKNYSIGLMNTNKEDLNGLIYSEDKALIERLVIIEYIKNETNKTILNNFSKTYDSIKDDLFYSLFHYLKYERDINNFKPFERYNSIDKKEFIETAKLKYPNFVIRWLIDCVDNENSILVPVRDWKNEVDYIMIDDRWGNKSYNEYKRTQNKYSNIKIDYKDVLINWGFEAKHKATKLFQANHYLLIEADAFYELMIKLGRDCEFLKLKFDEMENKDNDDDEQEQEKTLNEIIDEIKKTSEGFEYVLIKDMSKEYKQQIIDKLVNDGFEYHSKVSRTITKRGYKKLITH